MTRPITAEDSYPLHVKRNCTFYVRLASVVVPYRRHFRLAGFLG